MTEREKAMIEAYLPNPRDPELGDDEYYVLDTAGKVRRVYVSSICPCGEYDTTYGCNEVSTNRRIDAGWGSWYTGFKRSNMYDNKIDCRNQTHFMYDNWEKLRELQAKEVEI